MKILKQGRPQNTRVWKGTCLGCKSEMSETQNKLTLTYDQMDGPSAKAECPVCEKEFFLSPTTEYED